LSHWAFLEVLEYVGKLGILIAIITFFYPGCSQRKQATESAKQAAAGRAQVVEIPSELLSKAKFKVESTHYIYGRELRLIANAPITGLAPTATAP